MKRLIVVAAMAIGSLLAVGKPAEAASYYMGWFSGKQIYCTVPPTVIARPTGTLRSYCINDRAITTAWGWRDGNGGCNVYRWTGNAWKYADGHIDYQHLSTTFLFYDPDCM